MAKTEDGKGGRAMLVVIVRSQKRQTKRFQMRKHILSPINKIALYPTELRAGHAQRSKVQWIIAINKELDALHKN